MTHFEMRLNGSGKGENGMKRLSGEDSADSCLSFATVSCRRIVADFRFLRDFQVKA